ncbi:MAG: glycoside hydrolase family 99-like domain-containing protein [Candidatus Shapirobacteria bacterium]
MTRFLRLSLFFSFFILVNFTPVEATAVSVPHPIDTPGYMIGAFYMPKQDSLTREWASLRKWNSEGGSGVTRWPYLGLYSGKDTEAMNWQIKWAVEHGVSLFVFDWYTQPQYQDKVINPTWNLSITSFLSAEYNSYMKFSLYFTSIQMIDTGLDTADVNQSKEELEKIADYWSDNYFNKPNYLKADNKPVVFMDFAVPSLNYLGYNNVLTWMRQRAIQKGFPGIYFVGMRGAYIDDNEIGWYKGAMDDIYNSSFEAVSAYGDNFKDSGHECGDYPSTFGNFSNKILTYASSKNKHFIPPLSVFFDGSTMVSQPYKCNNPSSGIFLDTLSAAKTAITNNAKGALNINGQNVIVISSWNEWLEGSNIEPGTRLGSGGDPFSYLKAVRSVFAPGVVGEAERPAQSKGPTETGPFDILPDSADVFQFNKQNIMDKWWVQGGASAFTLSENLYGRSFGAPFYDSYTKEVAGNFLFWRGVNLKADDYAKAKIKFKCRAGLNFDTDCKLKVLWLHWISDRYHGSYYNKPLYANYFIAKETSAALSLPENNEFEIDLPQNSDWRGQIQEIMFRLSFVNPPIRLDLAEVTFVKIFNCPTCPAGILAKNLGNANCDTKVNALDFALWVKQDPAADFNCRAGQSQVVIDQEDLRLWLANYAGQN